MTLASTTDIKTSAGDRAITITRELGGTPEQVFRAFTDPELIPQWWGPAKYAVTVDVYEPHHGGRWRFLTKGADGIEHNFRGVIHEIVPNQRIVQTFEYEGVPGHVCLETAYLEPTGDGHTLITTVSVFQSIEARDGMIASGMEEGLHETYERLDTLLKQMD